MNKIGTTVSNVIILVGIIVAFNFTLSDIATASGKIVVNNDEYALSDVGFSYAPDAAIFATNVASWFTGGISGSFLVYSDDFGYTGADLANTMIGAGHSWTVSTSITFDLPTLLNYDGVFIGGYPANNQVLIDYVNAGGNVFLSAGTGNWSSASEEAMQWNNFLNAFGLELFPNFNGITGNISISSSHPIFNNVNSLYQNNGNSVIDLEPLNSNNQILVTSGDQGLFAVVDIPDALADLIITKIKNIPNHKKRGGKFTIKDVVMNQGNAAAGPFTNAYYLSIDEFISGDDIEIEGSRSILSLDVGEKSSNKENKKEGIKPVKVRIPIDTPLGKYYIIVCADSEDQVTESDETNNCMASKKTIKIHK